MDLVAEEEPTSGAEVAAQVVAASGALDEIFSKIDAGELDLTPVPRGVLPGLVKAALERGSQAELTGHLRFERGAEKSLFANSRSGSTAKTVATSVGDIELNTPRDREGGFTPRLVPKGSRRLGGLDDMTISLYAGGMTFRDIEHTFDEVVEGALVVDHQELGRILALGGRPRRQR